MTINKKIKAKYTTDFGIRIYAPKPSKNYWRISYVDQEGKLRDTTATSEKMALDGPEIAAPSGIPEIILWSTSQGRNSSIIELSNFI